MMSATSSPDFKSEITKYLCLLKAFNEFFKRYKQTFFILDFNRIRQNLDDDSDKEKLTNFEESYKNMLLQSEALWFQKLYDGLNFIIVEAEQKIQALEVKPRKTKKQKSENDEQLKKIAEQEIFEKVKKELSFFLEQLPKILKTTTTLIDLMIELMPSISDHRDIERNLKRDTNQDRALLARTFIDTVGDCTFQGISRFTILLKNVIDRMNALPTDDFLKTSSQLCAENHSIWKTKLNPYDSTSLLGIPESTGLSLEEQPAEGSLSKTISKKTSKRASTNFGQENPKLLVICNQLLQEIVRIKNANGSNSTIELHRVFEEIEQEIIDAFLNHTEPGILDTFKERCQGILEQISTHDEYFNLINALDIPITPNRNSKLKEESNAVEDFYSNFKSEDIEKYKDTLEKKFLEKAIEFLNRYFSVDKFRLYKNSWKKKLTSNLKDQFNLLYKMSYAERQNYILNNQCASIWQVCIHIIKKAFFDYGKSHKAISGNFKTEFQKGLAYLEQYRPRNVLLTTEELLTGSIGNSKLSNPALKITGNSPVVLISMILRVNDYYQNTLLGKKICSTFNIEKNDSDGWKDEIEKLCSRLINSYVQNPNVSLQPLLTDLENTINSIRGHFTGRSGWLTNGSRLAGTLEQIYDLFSNTNVKKYDDESATLDTRILESVKIDDVDQANLYIRQHIINQTQQRFGTYNDTVSHRLLARTDTEKLFTFNQISDRLIKLQRTQEINSETTVGDVIKNMYSIFDDELMICGKIQTIYFRGEFFESYYATNSYLKTLLPKPKNPVSSDKDSVFIAKISDLFNKYSHEKRTRLNPVFWKQSLARTIKVKLNHLYKTCQQEGFGVESVEERCEEILRQSLIEHNHTLDTVDADFKQAMQFALNACKQTVVRQESQNVSSVDLSKINVTSTQRKPLLLVSFILKISDYYCNSPLAKPLCDKYPALTLNDSFGWQKEVQALANIMLKQYLRTNQNLDTEMPLFLTHLKHVIEDIESKPFSADSRLLTTLKFVYNRFCPAGGASTNPYAINRSIFILPTLLFNELDEGKIQQPVVHQNYIARHVITQISELYATYEDSVAKCWSTTTKPMKLITAEKVRNSLEQLKLECVEETSVEVIVEKVADIFVQHHSMLDHIMPIFYQKKEPGFFQAGNEYSKMYGKVVQYLEAICPNTLNDKLKQKMDQMTRVAPATPSV